MNSRAKGGRGEREVVELFAPLFPDAGRAPRSGADPRWKGDVIEVPGFHVEVKRAEKLRLWESLEQAHSQAREEQTPLLVFRRNRSEWHVALPLDEFLAIVKETL